MTDATPVTIARGDLRRIYAIINAHECVIRAMLRVLSAASENQADALELFRREAMERADILERPANSPNADFIDQGRVETVAFVAETFEAVR